LCLTLLLLFPLLTANQLSLGDSSPYTSTDKTNKNKYTNETIQKTQNKQLKNSKYKYTYYQNTHTLQNKLKQSQYKIYPNEIVTTQSSTLSIRSP